MTTEIARHGAGGIRRDKERYEDTPLWTGPHIGIGVPVTHAGGWDEADWTDIRTALQDAAERNDRLVAELREPVIAQMGDLTAELKAELEELGWSRGIDVEPLADATAVIRWIRHDSGGDMEDSAIHLLNGAEVEHIAADTLSLALDRIWNAREGDERTRADAAAELARGARASPAARRAAGPMAKPARMGRVGGRASSRIPPTCGSSGRRLREGVEKADADETLQHPPRMACRRPCSS